MKRYTGTTVRGLRAPMINEGDDIVAVVVNTVIEASKGLDYSIENRDIVALTESIVARAQGNYVSIDDIAEDVSGKFTGESLGVIFPILSRNRFSMCLEGIARGVKKVVLMLSYPSDEVGNHLVSLDALDEKGINPWVDVLTEESFKNLFGNAKHTFTGVDYVSYYKSIVESCGVECEVIFSNNPKTILNYTKQVLTCDIHSRQRTKKILKANGAHTVYGMDDLCRESINGSGFNSQYGLLGSNKATESKVKLFPEHGQSVVEAIQKEILKETGKLVEVMVYGDGAFKDPVGQIWELADPVVSPAYTSGLAGTPNEVKIKYLADNHFAHLKGEALNEAISEYIKNKSSDLKGSMESQGTTPRRITDLVGSLCDLTSGSGDKGTPIVYIQGYFDHYATNS